MTVVRSEIPEERIPDKRLGRHVEHDERSRAYGIVSAPVALTTRRHRRWGVVFDQGFLGSCTGNAVAGAVNTKGVHRRGQRLLGEPDAVDVYKRATQLDSFDGGYPPDDTGSSGLAACKAAVEMGLIGEYRHAFGIAEALQALMWTPVVTGVDWYESFDRPAHDGLVTIGGQVRGGHEFEVVAFESHRSLDDSIVECVNSWGSGWGVRGRFRMTVATWSTLLQADGDVTVPS